MVGLLQNESIDLNKRVSSRTLFYSWLACEFDVASDGRTVFGVDYNHPFMLAREDLDTGKCARYFHDRSAPIRCFAVNETTGMILIGNFRGDLFQFQTQSGRFLRKLSKVQIVGLSAGTSFGRLFAFGDTVNTLYLINLSPLGKPQWFEFNVECKNLYCLGIQSVKRRSIFCGGSFKNCNIISVFHF